jgi:hypothetical protein
MPAAEKERRSLRRWLRGRVRNAEELASTYREDGAVHTAAKQEGRAEAFKAVLLVLDADDRKAGRA